jgi:hypothetical protein
VHVHLLCDHGREIDCCWIEEVQFRFNLVKNVTRPTQAVKYRPLGCPCLSISMDGVAFLWTVRAKSCPSGELEFRENR